MNELIGLLLRFWSIIVIIRYWTICAQTVANRTDEMEKIFNRNDFYELVIKGVFVDKSCLITEVLAATETDKAIFVTQPSGYGKTLNLNMLKRFFELDESGRNRILFSGGILKIANNDNNNNNNNNNNNINNITLTPLKVADHAETMKYLGEFPVIYVNFGDVTGDNVREFIDSLTITINRLLDEHSYLRSILDNEPYDRQVFNYSGPYERDRLERSLMAMARLTHVRYGRRVILLIDDYDVPIVNAYLRFGEYGNFGAVRDVFWAMYMGCFKNSPYIERGIVSGILPYPSDIFGLTTNATDYDVFDQRFSPYYGFRLEEVVGLFDKIGVKSQTLDELNYRSPASVTRYLSGRRREACTTNRKWFVNEAFRSDDVQADIQRLSLGENITFEFDRDLTFSRRPTVNDRRLLLLNLLTHAGYLRPLFATSNKREKNIVSGKYNASVSSESLKPTFHRVMLKWVCRKLNITESDYAAFVNLLIVGRVKDFRELLPRLVGRLKTKSAIDGELSKVFYRSFALCLLKQMTASYRVIAGRKSIGQPESNTIFVPKDKSDPDGIVIVLTYALVEDDSASLDAVAERNLEKIADVRQTSLFDNGSIKSIYRISIVFRNEKAALAYKRDHI